MCLALGEEPRQREGRTKGTTDDGSGRDNLGQLSASPSGICRPCFRDVRGGRTPPSVTGPTWRGSRWRFLLPESTMRRRDGRSQITAFVFPNISPGFGYKKRKKKKLHQNKTSSDGVSGANVIVVVSVAPLCSLKLLILSAIMRICRLIYST